MRHSCASHSALPWQSCLQSLFTKDPGTSVCPQSPEVCTLLLAAHLLGDQISLLNWLGFALCLSGISLHVALKALHSRGDGGPKPLKGLGSSPDLELLLRSSQQEEDDNEEEQYFVAQGQL
uniref:Uncharacterized protein n=1 Tax=Prolemur simus TaxID=1328070 RepID=A0A8C8YFS5_PROSS